MTVFLRHGVLFVSLFIYLVKFFVGWLVACWFVYLFLKGTNTVMRYNTWQAELIHDPTWPPSHHRWHTEYSLQIDNEFAYSYPRKVQGKRRTKTIWIKTALMKILHHYHLIHPQVHSKSNSQYKTDKVTWGKTAVKIINPSP